MRCNCLEMRLRAAWRRGLAAARARRLRTRGSASPARVAASRHASSAAAAPRRELSRHFLVCAVPMVGFGLMDNTIMIHAGNLIDCTLGVTFGLSTLSAAVRFSSVLNKTPTMISPRTES